MKIVATLMAGIIGTEHYSLNEKDQVFLFDAEGQGHEITGPLAAKVRETIKIGEKGPGSQRT